VATNNITGKRYIDHRVEAGFECASPIKNSGAGAAMMRIEAARGCTVLAAAPVKASGMEITGTAAGLRKPC
jgi:hypothetical protein